MARGAGANLVALGVSQVLGAVAAIFVAREVGAAGVGALALVFGLFAVLHPLAAFTATASVVQHAKTPDRARVFGTSLALKAVVALGLLALAAAFARPVAAFLRVEPALVVVAGTGYLAATGYEVALNRLEAENRMYARSIVLPVGPLVYLALVLLVVDDVVEAAAATVAGSFAMSLVALPHLKGIPPRLDRDVARFMWRMGSVLVVGDLLLLGLLWFDTFIVSFYLDKAAAGVYQTAYNFGLLLVTAATVLEVSLVPLLSQARARGGDLATAYHAGSILALALAVAAIVLLVPLGPFILGLYGPEFVAAYPSLLVLLGMGTAGALFFPVKAVLAAVERPGLVVRLTLLELAVNVPLNLLLIPRYGILGAAIAATIAFAVGTLLGWVLVWRHARVLPFPRPSEWGHALRRMF